MWSLLKQPPAQLAWSAQAEAAVTDLLFLHVAWNVFCRVFILIPHLFSKEACRTDAILWQPVLPLPWAVLCIPTRACGASPGCRLSSGPWGISPAPPSAPPLAGRGATLSGSVVVPCAFFCIIHDPKRSKFFSSLHTSSYQVLSELMLPSLEGMDFFGGWDFSAVYSDRVGNKVNVSWERQSWIWLERTQSWNSGCQGWRDSTLVWDWVTQRGRSGVWIRLREWQASPLLTTPGGKHNFKSRQWIKCCGACCTPWKTSTKTSSQIFWECMKSFLF